MNNPFTYSTPSYKCGDGRVVKAFASRANVEIRAGSNPAPHILFQNGTQTTYNTEYYPNKMTFSQKFINTLTLLSMMSMKELVKLKDSLYLTLDMYVESDELDMYCAARILIEAPQEAIKLMNSKPSR